MHIHTHIRLTTLQHIILQCTATTQHIHIIQIITLQHITTRQQLETTAAYQYTAETTAGESQYQEEVSAQYTDTAKQKS